MFYGDASKGRFRIYGKGRRFGATHAAAIWCIDKMQQGNALLWGDVIYSNIDRYVQRNFIPFMKDNDIAHNWNVQKKLLIVGSGYTDFRSADNPLTWEGFGYDRIFLNEAGIILDDEYLYNNAILPMLIDNENSELIAAGTPKIQQGKGLLFQELYNRCENGEEGYYGRTFSTYDNPFITKKSIQSLEKQIPAYVREQEIYGKFIKGGGSVINMKWFKHYKVPPANFEKIVQSWDTASKEKEINDPSCCTTWLETTDGTSYLLDCFCERLEYPSLKRSVKSLAERWNPNVILIEDKSSGISLIQDLNDDATFYYNIIPIEPVNDKVTRMATASLDIEAGKVYLPEFSEWLPEYEKELRAFPNKKVKKDRVDSTSQYLNNKRKSTEIFIG